MGISIDLYGHGGPHFAMAALVGFSRARCVLLPLQLLLLLSLHSIARAAGCTQPSRSAYPAPASTICNISSQSSGLMIYAYSLQDGRAPGIGWQLLEYSDAGDLGVKVVDLTPVPGHFPSPPLPLSLSRPTFPSFPPLPPSSFFSPSSLPSHTCVCVIPLTSLLCIAGFAVNGVEAQADLKAATCETTACDGTSAQATHPLSRITSPLPLAPHPSHPAFRLTRAFSAIL
jgi:hypothetical protein